jgi:DinB superfamily
MTAEERAHVVQQLKDSEREYLFSIANVSEAQWNWKPAPDRWSVGQTAEHIMQSEVVLFRRIQHATRSPANPDWEKKTAGKTEVLERVMPDRSQKATAPEATQPQGLSKEEVVSRFKELRAQIIKFAEETQIPLEEYTAEHPFPNFSTLNTYQWLLLVPLHNRRHDHQIAEVKATPGYPK